MQLLFGSALNGFILGAVYILVALGFALLLSILGIFNFAHGAVYMIGAYITYLIAVRVGISQWISLLIAIVVTSLLGLFIERFCFRPFIGKPGKGDAVIVMAIALILIIETTVSVTVGGYDFAVRSFIPGVVNIGYFSASIDKFMTLGIAAVLLTAMFFFIRNSRTGQQMLAIAQDREGAFLQGIDIHRVSALSCLIACAMAGLAGGLMSSLYTMGPFMGDPMLFKAIEVIILSGIGSVGGILGGGLIIGFLDAILPVYVSGAASQAISLVIIIVILLVRPKGLFGYELF